MQPADDIFFEKAGPREKLFFNPKSTTAAIVTCGGLCPGLNDIIRSIVLELHYAYGVRNIFGIRYGLQGLIARYGHELIDLTPESVVNIHDRGGTVLGSSRGPQDIDEIIERIKVGVANGPGVAASKKICEEAIEVTSKLAITNGGDRSAEQRFWELYYGEMNLL